MQKEETLDFNEQFTRAYDLMEKSPRNLFITGRAGTGKSTLLQYFRAHTRKSVVVLAPTGVAAVNVRGQTIHSFFGFKPDITPEGARAIRVRKAKKNLYRKLQAVVIDEISMVRADLLDCVDVFLRLHGPDKSLAFGGIQMIFIGDLYQLSPVVASGEKAVFGKKMDGDSGTMYQSPYFFDARVFAPTPECHLRKDAEEGHSGSGFRPPEERRKDNEAAAAVRPQRFMMELIELEKIYRQKDQDFIALLNAIRNNSVTEQHLDVLNKRCLPAFRPEEKEFYIHLTTTNAMADEINRERLSGLKGKAHRYEGTLSGGFDIKSLPTQEILDLKIGAQVMLLNNDSRERWINGTIGKIFAVEKVSGGPDIVRVELPEGGIVEVTSFTWEMFRFFYNEETGALDSETAGSFTQYPLRLAWAVTIHKAQGKTFPKVIVDIGRGTFSHGQVYVALSRAVTLEGLVLKKPILKKHIWMDRRVVRFMTEYQYRRAEEKCPLEEKRKILEQAIEDGAAVDILYLRANDEKTKRVIRPRAVGEMEYNGKTYLGVEAYCFERKENRIFRVDRILEMKAAG